MELFKKIVLSSMLIFLTIFIFYRPIEIEDNWWHLSTGRWMAENHTVPHQDPFPTFKDQKPWILTQWLGSSLLYAGYAIGGFEGLKLTRLFVFMVIVGIFYFYARRKIPIEFLIPIIFLMEYGLMGRVLVRPDIFNYIFIQLFLILLFDHNDSGRKKNFWLLLGLGVLWGNIHLGSFVYGYFLIFLFLFSACVRWILLQITNKNTQEKKVLGNRAKDLLILFCVYPLTFFISPYGVQAGVYPFKVFFIPSFIHIYEFVNVIQEAFPPTYIFSSGGFWFFILLFTALIALFYNKKDQLLYFFIFIFPLFLFLRGSRACGFFVVTTVYVIVQCASNCRFFDFWKSYRFSRSITNAVVIMTVLVLASRIIHGLTERIYDGGRFRSMSSVTVDPRLPVPAIEFLNKNKITGVVFANDNLGGFLIWSAYPELRPFIDGRQIHPDYFFKEVEVLNDPKKFWPRLSADFNLNIVLLDLSSGAASNFVQYLSNAPDWQLIFLKGVNVIFVKRGAFALSESVNLFEASLKEQAVKPEDMKVLADVNALSPMKLKKAPKYNEILEESYTLFGFGFQGAAVSRLIDAYQVSDDKDVRGVMKNAYIMLQQKKRKL